MITSIRDQLPCMSVIVRVAILVCAATATILALAVSGGSQPAGTAPTDYVLLFDVSGSMNGKLPELGNQSKLQYVKAVAVQFATQIDISLGVRVYVYTFDAGIQSSREFVIDSDQQKNDLINYIEAFNANGKQTWIYQSLDEVANRHRGTETPLLILLYTDGEDTGDYSLDFVISSLHDLQQDRYYCVYYTMIGFEHANSEIQANISEDLDRLNNETKFIPNTGSIPPPIRTVRPKQRSLHFGNLRVDPEPSRVIHFYSDGANTFPDSFRLFISVDFPSLWEVSDGMVEAAISPGTLERDSLIPLEAGQYTRTNIALIADNIEHVPGIDGQYEGTINFTSNDPTILVIPDNIHAVLTYEPEKVVTVSASHEDEFNIGKLDPYAGDNGTSESFLLWFEYNQAALDKGGSLEVRVVSDPERRGENWDSVRVLVDGQMVRKVSVSPGVDSVSLKFQVPRGTAEGKYSFRIEWSSNDMTVDGTQGPINGGFKVPPEPWPWWKWAVLVVLIALVIFALICVGYSIMVGEGPGYCFGKLMLWLGIKKLLFKEGTLVVVQPKESAGQEYNLAGSREAVVGDGGDFLGEIEGLSVKLTPIAKDSKVEVLAEVVTGDVHFREQGQSVDLPLSTGRLYDGDELIMGEYVIQFSSHQLIRM